MKRHLALLQEYSLPLLAGVIAAVVWANLDPAGYAHALHWSPLGAGSALTLHFVVNDVFMVLFFAIAAGEIVEACLPGGGLHPPRAAINPLLATLGGVVGPALVYLAWSSLTGDASIRSGWGVPTATDIALAWLVARAVFGRGHPAVSFLLLLAVADDGLGLGIIAVFYPDPAHPVQPAYLGMVAAALAIAWAMGRARVRGYWLYLLGPGALSWAGLHLAHLHPALALVAVVPFMPRMDHDEGMFAELPSETPHRDTLNRFQRAFALPVELGLFAFGLANAGVAFSAAGNATWAVLAALIVGKTAGILAMGALAHALGFPLPRGVGYRELLVIGLTAGLGLTVALFVAGVAFTDPALTAAAKMGALFSIAVAPIAIGAGRLLGVRTTRRFSPAANADLAAEPG